MLVVSWKKYVCKFYLPGVITYILQILFAQHLKWHVRMSIWEAALLWLAVLAEEGSAVQGSARWSCKCWRKNQRLKSLSLSYIHEVSESHAFFYVWRMVLLLFSSWEYRDGSSCRTHCPSKNMFIHQQVWYDYETNPIETHDLEFGVQPTAFHKNLQRFAASWAVRVVVRMDRVLPCTLRPKRCSSWLDTESWCVGWGCWVKIALYYRKCVFYFQFKG